MKKLIIKNTSNILYDFFGYTNYLNWFKKYLLNNITKTINYTNLINNHFLFIHFWYKQLLEKVTLVTQNKLFYLYHNAEINIHNGLEPKKISYYTNKKTLTNHNLTFCGEFIFTRKFFTFKQLQPRTSFKINKKKRNRQINTLKKTVIKLKK